MTTVDRILTVLADGPAAACEIAVALGMDQRLINAHCCAMYSRPGHRLTRTKHFNGRRTVWLYAPRGRRGLPG